MCENPRPLGILPGVILRSPLGHTHGLPVVCHLDPASDGPLHTAPMAAHPTWYSPALSQATLHARFPQTQLPFHLEASWNTCRCMYTSPVAALSEHVRRRI